MTGILTAIAFIVIFSILVLVHEVGHFLAARKAKIKVEEFGFGLPPRAKELWKDELGTVFSLNWIPFGGFVKMLGEDATDAKILKNPKSFANKTIWQRFSVIVAGVTLNFLTAILLLSIAFTFGVKPFILTQEDFAKQYEAGNIVGEPHITINAVESSSPALQAGLKAGDVILSVDDKKILFAEDIVTEQQGKTSVEYKIKRGEKNLTLKVEPNIEGKIGISLDSYFQIEGVKPIRYPFYRAPWEAVKASFELGKLTVVMFGRLLINLTQFILPKDVAGPVGIVQMTHQIVALGEFMELVKFTALLSVSLAVINILPFPALDGGRLVFLLYEFIFRRKPSAKVEATIHAAGYAFLMCLIVIVTWNDLDRILHFSELWGKIVGMF